MLSFIVLIAVSSFPNISVNLRFHKISPLTYKICFSIYLHIFFFFFAWKSVFFFFNYCCLLISFITCFGVFSSLWCSQGKGERSSLICAFSSQFPPSLPSFFLYSINLSVWENSTALAPFLAMPLITFKIIYLLQFEADVSGTPFDAEIKLPVIIGTIPLEAPAPGTPYLSAQRVITKQPSGKHNTIPLEAPAPGTPYLSAQSYHKTTIR